jgi:hypothetical protein
MYQKQEEEMGAAMDVNLLSKDMELNFSNKNDDDDELDMKPNGTIDKDEDPTNDDDKVEEQKAFY